MPAIITHDFFGRDVYDDLFQLIGGSKDEADAFLLGNQGPDPLFYSVITPTVARFHTLGTRMHLDAPSELIHALKASIFELDEHDRAIGRAYALGFICHYSLDSTMHPFVYASQFALCDAGVHGLSREDGSEVHAIIESEFDEMVLFTKRGLTIASFNPSREILQASERVLRIISAMYAFVASTTYGVRVPKHLFSIAVHDFRIAQRAFRSPSGIKRSIVGAAEEIVRPYSFFRAMSHRNVALSHSAFDNHDHAPWTCPFTGSTSTDGFWELYDQALHVAKRNIVAFESPSFSEAEARALTGELNFSGEPAAAYITSVEPISAKEDACSR
ncbi:zinc dependent phospholipase C family protein [Adlercreutzia sp. ZJ138]|uniref:zinc dependent phospholipase C family protein n=1 Tax=Adlercreutzia sp. ZJ138 TaxID=2709405 RepID=UPI0013EC0475|nr:zinc dependent phospholipase C family protein [Adlercreutzia sp. ZJ138]